VVPEKRKLMVVSGAIAAALALPGCAPAGYNAADYGAGAPATDNAASAADASPSAAAKAKDAPELTDDQLTTELNGTKVARMGEVVEDNNGYVLYRFEQDSPDPSKSTCAGDCAKIWPPALTDGEPQLDGVSTDDIGTVERADGTKQLTLAGWPLYRYIGDKKAGTWKGQNVAGKWFVVKPNGKKNLTCLPPVSKAVAPPADDNGADDNQADDNGADDNGADDSAGQSGGSGSDYSY
jgi:predicted lipoprotein with Yx(FWY)xxD motif